jgi:hypothetical protein
MRTAADWLTSDPRHCVERPHEFVIDVCGAIEQLRRSVSQ